MTQGNTNIYQFFVLSVLFYHINSYSIYISKNGMDYNSCGSSVDNPCGTLFFASKLINENVNITELIINDGQNEALIANYDKQRNQYSYHPCFPQPFNKSSIKKLDISFNDSSFITDMKHWYPEICHNISISNYNNEYMFDFFNPVNLTFYNLYINDYENGLAFIRIKYHYSADQQSIVSNAESIITCYHCKFNNLFHSINDDIPLIYSTTGIKLINNSFSNITTSANNIISMAIGYLTLKHVSVEHCLFGNYFIMTTTKTDIGQTNSYHNNTLILNQCVFDDISTTKSLMNDVHTESNLSISNTIFTNINSGAIFVGGLYEPECIVNIRDVTISTSQIIDVESSSYSDDVYNNLLYFHYSNNVQINNLKLIYHYNVDQNCNFSNPKFVLRSDDSLLNSDDPTVMIYCKNPLKLIRNIGRINMTSISFSVNKTQNQIANYTFSALKYEDSVMSTTLTNVYASIINDGTMFIDDLLIDGLSFCDKFIFNQGVLFINDIRFNLTDYIYDPNALQSLRLIDQISPDASIHISNSYLIGGYIQIELHSGSLNAFNVKFTDAAQAVVITASIDIVIDECIFIRVGRYFSNLRGLKYIILTNVSPISVLYSSYITINNSTFSGYDHNGLVFIFDSDYITIKDNDFTVNINNLSYHILQNNLVQYVETFISIWFTDTEVSIIGNTFYPNPIFENKPWISMYRVSDICISANNFSNYAFSSIDSNVTSCFRRDIMKCFDNATNCMDGMYGSLDEELFNKSNTFNIYNKDVPILFAYTHERTVHTVLDNININLMDDNITETEQVKALQINNNILIMDSVLTTNNAKPTNFDIWYSDSCNIHHNDRLINQDNYISKLMITCDPPNSQYNYLNTRNALINYVETFSATQLDFRGQSSTYFPGQKLTFTYDVLDLFNSPINTSTFFHWDENTILLVSEELSVSQKLNIDKMGKCDVCKDRILIPTIGLDGINHTHPHQHKMQLFFDNLTIINNEISIETVSCPIGYGADKNDFCHICESGTYNLLPNNNETCLPCHKREQHKGIDCRDGEIFVDRNYWVGFEIEDNAHVMISGECPSGYCCITTQCEYIGSNQTDLCVFGRDYSSAMCGQCLEGYSQAMNSIKCVKCNGNNIMWLFWPFGLALFFTIYIIISQSKLSRIKNKKKAPRKYTTEFSKLWQKLLLVITGKYFMMMIKTFIFKILFYYQQALSQTLWPSTSHVNLYNIATFFDLSVEFNTAADNSDDLWCFIDGLTTRGKILCGLITSTMIFALFFIICSSISLCQCKFECARKISINYTKALIIILLICVGHVFSVIFKLVNCQKIGTEWRHFYFASEQCSVVTIICSGAALIIILLIFLVMFLKLRDLSPRERANNENSLNILCKYYKPQYYYWEG
eukprot:62564_1